MPPIDRPGLPQPRRRKRHPSGSRPETAGNPNVAVAPRGSNVFHENPLESPITHVQRVQQHRVDRVRRRLPRVPVAAPPLIAHPTPTQTRAARKLITQSITRAVGPSGTPLERLARREAINREILTDPRYSETRKTIQHYAQAESDHAALAMAKLYGVRGSRQHRVRTGRSLIAARSQPFKPGPPPPHGVGGLATILADKLYGATSLGSASAENAFVKNAFSDVKTLGEAPFVGGLALAKLGAEAVTGHPGRAAKEVARFGKGVAESTVQEVKHPGDYLRQHPLLFALDVGGATTVAGRLGGALARGLGSDVEAAGVRGALARTGTTIRPPLALTDEPHGPIHERRYSKDLTRKAAQVADDARREPLRDSHGQIVTVMQSGHRVPVLKATRAEREGGLTHRRAGLLGEQTNFEAARANAGERLMREQDARALHVPNRAQAAAGRVADRARAALSRETRTFLREKGVKGRAGRDAVMLAADATIRSVRTWTEDLTKYRDRVAAALEHHRTSPETTPFLHKGDVAEARRNVRLANKMLEAPVEQRRRIVSLGEQLGRRLNDREEALLAEGVYTDRARIERARVIHAAVQHLDARHFHEPDLAALERAGVDVRHPEQEARYRAAQSGARDAVQERRDAEQALRSLEHKRARLVGAQASRRGRRQAEALGSELKSRRGSREAGKATTAERKKLAKLDAQIEHARADLRAKTKAARDAKRKLERTPRPPLRASLRHANGQFLSTEEIHAAIRAGDRDPASVAYLPTGELGGRAFHARFDQARPVMDKPGTRTGSQYAKGATHTSAELLVQQGVRQGTQLNKARAIDRFVSDNGTVHPSGRDFTMAEAQELVKRAEIDSSTTVPSITMGNGTRMTPIRRFSARLPEEAQRIIRDELQGPGAMDSLHQYLLNDRFLYDEADVRRAGAENMVLVPTRKLEQQMAHLRPAGVLERFFQLLNRPFRMAVLPQPRWLTGNFVEPYIVRLTVAGSGLNVFGLAVDWIAAGKALRSMERSGDPALVRAAHEIRAQQYGGLFVGGRGATVRRGLEDFPKIERAYGAMVSRLPVTRQAAEMSALALRSMGAPLRAFFRANRAIEAGAQRAAFGRQFRRDLQEFTGMWTATIRLQQKAIDEVAKGYVNTPTQQRAMRMQHELLGKYEGYGPTMRAWIQGPMPFIPWALNAARFVYWTMPVHHTALTALLVKVNDVVAQDWADQHSDAPPGGLRLAPRTKRGGYVDIARYTPYGLTGPAVEGDLGGVTGNVAPQFQGAVEAIGGKDPFGRDLEFQGAAYGQSPSVGQKVGVAGYGLAEALVPYLSTARRLREGGGTAYAGSTVFSPKVKPGTQYMSAPRRVFDPFRPTYLHAPSSDVPKAGDAARNNGRGDTADDRIDAALDRLQQMDDAQAAQDERINRALDAIGLP